MGKLKDGDVYYWTFTGFIKHVTDKGGVLVFDGTKEVWLAKSQIINSEDVIKDAIIEVIIPQHIAEEKELV